MCTVSGNMENVKLYVDSSNNEKEFIALQMKLDLNDPQFNYRSKFMILKMRNHSAFRSLFIC